jgi:gamma-glutamylaminecyclotransferase
MAVMKLFVYGTLRRGERAHGLLRGARLLAKASTPARFTLVEMAGGYPALVHGGCSAVRGEIYGIDESLLRELDPYEDVPELYLRVRMNIAGHDCWVYVLRPEHARGLPVIASGDWKQR